VGANSGFFQGWQKDFPGGPKVVKFHFTHPKLRKRPFFAKNLIGKFQITGKALAPLQRPCVQTEAETSDTAAEAVEADPARCSWRAIPGG